MKGGKFTKRPAWPANKNDTTESLVVGPYSGTKMRRTAAATESSASAPRGGADRANSAEHIKIHDEVDDQVVTMVTDANTEPPAIMMNSSRMGELDPHRQSVPLVPLAKLTKIKQCFQQFKNKIMTITPDLMAYKDTVEDKSDNYDSDPGFNNATPE